MKKTFTKEYILKNKGCYDLKQVNKLSFINNSIIHIDDILNSEMSLKDKAWFLRNKCELTGRQLQIFVIGCAEVVLKIYETKCPNNQAPRKAIQAAKDYLDNKITISELKSAADAAYVAGAPYVTYAAAYAADVAAAYAADVAAAAAYVAADDDDSRKTHQENLLSYLKTFVESTPND